jgi:hypothetical protein
MLHVQTDLQSCTCASSKLHSYTILCACASRSSINHYARCYSCYTLHYLLCSCLYTLQFASEHPSFGANQFEAARYPCELEHTRYCTAHSKQVKAHSNKTQAQLRAPVSTTYITCTPICALPLHSYVSMCSAQRQCTVELVVVRRQRICQVL